LEKVLTSLTILLNYVLAKNFCDCLLKVYLNLITENQNQNISSQNYCWIA